MGGVCTQAGLLLEAAQFNIGVGTTSMKLTFITKSVVKTLCYWKHPGELREYCTLINEIHPGE